MNCKQANSININWLLSSNGNKPFRIGIRCTWYLSPFRTETIPSFRVQDNKFHDFGTGEKGGTLDLAMLIWKCSLGEALKRLEKINPVFSFPEQKKRVNYFNAITILEVKQIQSKALFAYLWKRGINPRIGKEYFREIVFHWEGGNPQYALGFQTKSGSWELRNSIYKLSTSPKDITLISKRSTTIDVFEGSFDFLSYLQLRKNSVSHDFLILNSTVNVEKALEELKNYKTINCFLDNDLEGRKALIRIEDFFRDKVHDFSKEYEPFKDLNDFLIHRFELR